MGRMVGVDYGLRRVGVALSDPRQVIASPLTTIQTGKTHAETVLSLLQALKTVTIELFVVGMPLHLNGTSSPMCTVVSQFVEALRQAQAAPVVIYDERFTTALADRLLREGGLNRKSRSQIADKVSASLLLQSYLERLQRDSAAIEPLFHSL